MEARQLTKSIKRGDTVQVIAGRERGKTGKILKVTHGGARVIIEKLNMVKRHTRPSAKNQFGGLVDKEAPLPISNVLLLCPKCNRGVRVGRKTESEKKVRFCRKCGEIL